MWLSSNLSYTWSASAFSSEKDENQISYKNAEAIISTQEGFKWAKLVEKESGLGNVIN